MTALPAADILADMAEARVVVDSHSVLGEGAFWDSDKHVLYWIDIERGYLHIYDPETGSNDRHQIGEKIGTVVPKRSGGVLLALEASIAAYDPGSRSLERLAKLEADRPDNRANDGKCDPAGRLWVGTLCMRGRAEEAALYRVDPDFSVHKMVTDVTISNGIVWSDDASIMYYIDTHLRRIDAFDFDSEHGTISNRRTCISTPESLGSPDGMSIDSEGNLWVAMYGGFCVSVWNPRSGKMVGRIDIPARNVTSCAFGGSDLTELYVTTASSAAEDSERERQPHAGGLFLVEVDARGTRLPAFSG